MWLTRKGLLETLSFNKKETIKFWKNCYERKVEIRKNTEVPWCRIIQLYFYNILCHIKTVCSGAWKDSPWLSKIRDVKVLHNLQHQSVFVLSEQRFFIKVKMLHSFLTAGFVDCGKDRGPCCWLLIRRECVLLQVTHTSQQTHSQQRPQLNQNRTSKPGTPPPFGFSQNRHLLLQIRFTIVGIHQS